MSHQLSHPRLPATQSAPRVATNVEGVHTQTTTGTPTPRGRDNRNIPKKKANIRIATLNMNGATAPSRKMNLTDKWAAVNKLMKTEKIAILALQETHLDDSRLAEVKRCFNRSLDIYNSSDPDTPRASAGVAIVINKALLAPEKTKINVLHQGRAIMMRLKWSNTENTSIINIYAPNNRGQHPTFWANVDLERRQRHLPKPEFVLGDFNMTEDAIDRSPPKENERQAVEALREIRTAWNIQDQWRHDNPSGRSFTHNHILNGNHEFARLDRIYTARGLANNLFDWKTSLATVPTDHQLTSVKYAPKDAPLIGQGRWTWPLLGMENETLMQTITSKGIQAQRDIEEVVNQPLEERTTTPLGIWNNLKSDIRETTKKHQKDRYKIKSKAKNLQEDIKSLIESREIDENERIREEIAFLSSELNHLQRKELKEHRDQLRAQVTHHGEKPGGIWTAINREKKPRDLIPRLAKPNTNPLQYERSSTKMAELARDYHESLQKKDTDEESEADRTHLIEQTLAFLPEAQMLSEPERSPLAQEINENQVESALYLSKNGSATGMDGCPYELWKALNARYQINKQKGEPGFDIIRTMTLVFQDIQKHGIQGDSEFTMGWMCPIYKKKDRAEISNYRPITLLNTDYKLLTKTLALQLIADCGNMVHNDQSGFIPRRSIFNNIRLASTILNYAEITETDGAIVALDQEKAYDRIRHDYLWMTLEKFKIPKIFINTVKELYKNAHTTVAINGIMSRPFQVTRGVRQGDPLSCALFNLAIEPLACRIRNDNNLKGYQIPGIEEKIIISLYADDTSLFLSKDDNMDYIQEILSSWCQASGAKFNTEKTEIIPIGSQAHRQKLSQTRKLNNNERQPLDRKIRITEDQEAVRILGAWIGNDTNAAAPWETVLDKINKALNRYNKSHPTLKGRKVITQIVIGGFTQFLTKAQGMPKHIEKALVKTTRDFLWEESTTPRIRLDYLYNDIEQGGLNLLDIKARNEAIEISWLRAYLNMSPTRPTWAKVTDVIIDAVAPQGHDAQARLNMFLQTWNAPTTGPRARKLGKETRRMLQTAREHNVSFAAIKLSQAMKYKMPAWFQIGSDPAPLNNRAAKCLLNRHQARTIADLLETSARVRDTNENQAHRPTNFCNCIKCRNDRTKGCIYPHDCAEEALRRLQRINEKMNPLTRGPRDDNLSLTPRRKYANIKARESNEAITFDPTTTCKEDVSECFRVFTNPERLTITPAQRLRNDQVDNRHNQVTVYTDGACMNNGKENARSGGGIWYGPDDPRNKAFRVPGNVQSNQTGELAAALIAIQDTPHFHPLEIVSDSKYVIEGLTKHLPEWENRGWIKTQNAPLFKKAAYLLKRRSAKTTFKWVKGHRGTRGNEESDRLAKEGAEKEIPEQIDLSVPKEFDLQGAKLSTVSQATAYRGIIEHRPQPSRNDHKEHIQAIKTAIEAINGTKETEAMIWRSMRKPVLRARVQQFLYKATHKAYMIGDRWTNVPGHTRRGICSKCMTTESITHILLECNSIECTTTWREAKKLWPHGDQTWPNITIGTILGIGGISLRRDRRRAENEQATLSMATKGRNRLLQIIISEASHLIWVIRCDRVINNKNHTAQQVQARWERIIRDRITTDRITAEKIKRDQKYDQLISATWDLVLPRLG